MTFILLINFFGEHSPSLIFLQDGLDCILAPTTIYYSTMIGTISFLIFFIKSTRKLVQVLNGIIFVLIFIILMWIQG